MRPTINPTVSAVDKAFDVSNKTVLALLWILTLFVIAVGPADIPTHFNAVGQPDRYGNKLSLLSLPCVATILYMGLSFAIKRPHRLNYLTPINNENAQRQYTQATKTLRYMASAMLCLFTVIVLMTYLTAIRWTNGLGAWLLPGVIGISAIFTLWTIMRARSAVK